MSYWSVKGREKQEYQKDYINGTKDWKFVVYSEQGSQVKWRKNGEAISECDNTKKQIQLEEGILLWL